MPFKNAARLCLMNSVDTMLWGPKAASCPWAPWVASVRAAFGL